MTAGLGEGLRGRETSPALLHCRRCGCRLVVERWLSPNQGTQARARKARADVGVRLTTGSPAWAVRFAAHGVDSVSRHRCPECHRVAAVLGHDFPG